MSPAAEQVLNLALAKARRMLQEGGAHRDAARVLEVAAATADLVERRGAASQVRPAAT